MSILLHILVLLAVKAQAELYTNRYGDILRQSPPILYQGGIIQYPKPGEKPNSGSYNEIITLHTLEGWKTTFTVEKSSINPGDRVTFTEIVLQTSAPPKKTEIYSLKENVVGEDFTTSLWLEVELQLTLGKTERNIRVRWLSTPVDTPDTTQWGFLDQGTYKRGFEWLYPDVPWIMLNLVSAGSASWEVQMGDTSLSLVEGEQLFGTANISVGDTISLLANATVASDMLLEWFPYVAGDQTQVNSSGCLSYINTAPATNHYRWLLKNETHANEFPGRSLKISFHNVTATSENFIMKVLVDAKEYLVAKHSLASNAVYYIPVSDASNVSLTLSSEETFTLILCYTPSSVADFQAVGYMRSNGYPEVIKSSHPSKVEGFPLPDDWSLITTLERLGIDQNRAWLDLVLVGGRSSSLLQSYTGSKTANYQPTNRNENRYADTEHIWLNYVKDFTYGASRQGPYEVVSTFQSVKEATPSRSSYDGYSLKLEARLQRASDGVGTVYFTGDSGTIASPTPYYTDTKRTFYDIMLSNTEEYNGIEFTFGDSYTESDLDLVEMYNHEGPHLQPADGSTFSGNMTGSVFAYKSTHMTVKFSSNECKEYRGFVIDWRGVYISSDNVTTDITRQAANSSVSEHTTSVVGENLVMKIDDEKFKVIVLSVVAFVLFICLILAAAVAIHARRKLSDIQRVHGLFTPKYHGRSESHNSLLSHVVSSSTTEDVEMDQMVKHSPSHPGVAMENLLNSSTGKIND